MIKLLVLDVDGCLSDGKLIYSLDGMESKNFNVKDGLGISTWIKMGYQVAIITGRKSTIVQRRSEELGVQHLYQGIREKDKVLLEVVKNLGIRLCEVAAIGDDLNDYAMLSLAGRSFTPSDGASEIKSLVKSVLTLKGGEGVVREMIDIVINENDQKEEFLAVWMKE